MIVNFAVLMSLPDRLPPAVMDQSLCGLLSHRFEALSALHTTKNTYNGVQESSSTNKKASELHFEIITLLQIILLP